MTISSNFEFNLKSVIEFAELKLRLFEMARSNSSLDPVLHRNILEFVAFLNGDHEIADSEDGDIFIFWDEDADEGPCSGAFVIIINGSDDHSGVTINFNFGRHEIQKLKPMLKLFKHRRTPSTWRVNLMDGNGALLAEAGYVPIHRIFKDVEDVDFEFWRRRRFIKRMMDVAFDS